MKFMTILSLSVIVLLGLCGGDNNSVYAGDGSQISAPKARYRTNTIDRVMISAVSENILMIAGKSYTCSRQTIMLKKIGKTFKPISIDEIPFPSLARITYQVYFSGDEAHPYAKNEAILTKVYIY